MPRRPLVLLVTLLALTAGCATRDTDPGADAPSAGPDPLAPTPTDGPGDGSGAPTAPTAVAEDEPRARCSPPGTPTCDPSGHVVEPGAPGATPPPGGQSTATMRTLDDVDLRVINLTGAAPQGLDVDPRTGLVYVANNGVVIAGCDGDAGTSPPEGAPAPVPEGARTLSVVDPQRGREVARVGTGAAPIWPLVDEKRHVVHVAGSGDGTVRVHRLGTGELLETIEVGGRPHAFALHPETGLLVVSNTNDSSQLYYAVLDAASATVVAQHPAPALPHGVAFDARDGVAYMVGVADGTVAVVNMTTGLTVATFDATSRDDANSNMMAFSPLARRTYVSETSPTSSVSVVDVDARRIVGRIAFGAPAWGMQVDEERRLLYVALPNLDAVGVADADTLEPLALVGVDDCPYAVRLDPQRGMGYTTGMVNATLSAFDLRKVEAALGR